MSTLDVVAYAGEAHGGVKPANFLDIGGGASAEVMANGLDIILGDPDVKCGVRQRLRRHHRLRRGGQRHRRGAADARRQATKPLVVRLDGNNVEEGRRILDEAAHPLVTQVDTMDNAADKAAELAACGSLTMAIFLNEKSKVIVQGMTGSEGTKHTHGCWPPAPTSSAG